ncbi:hypothetical protein BDV25DRAFT_135155 [Aspergillus avenaceus]|uniref:Uncharacterized protein n=1 Tax=Aspergillus avenaceus TaxID=36643 RepID=A0A5N6U933_ASPAV|nr:hypothetical protein BDV25DRAFT_135155 [Aspergillus avenaceus]
MSKPKTVVGVLPPRIEISKQDDFDAWYNEVLNKGGLVDRVEGVAGFVMKPPSYFLWESIKSYLDRTLKQIGHENHHLPFALAADPDSYGKRENDASDFPTNEDLIYTYCRKWIKSHHDLPLRINHYSSVSRSIPQCLPFLQNSEPLQQECHTFHLTERDAIAETGRMLDLYTSLYRDLLAVPVVNGRTRSKDPMTGKHSNTTILCHIPGECQWIEAATCQEWGQITSKKYNITVDNPDAERETSPPLRMWHNTYRLSSSAIGLTLALHGDDRGLVLPPRVAETQVYIVALRVPSLAERQRLDLALDDLVTCLSAVGVRVIADRKENASPGMKLHQWVIKGIPLFMDVGQQYIDNNIVTVRRRDIYHAPESKIEVNTSDIQTTVPALLEKIQEDMYHKANDDFHLWKPDIETGEYVLEDQ